MIFKLILIVSLTAFELPCSEYYCPSSNIKDNSCDESCMIEPCNYDSSDQYEDDYSMLWYGDCGSLCAEHCPISKLGDGTCDEECDRIQCAFDLGDCGYCASGCWKEKLGDGVCDIECSVPLCQWDGSDCGICAEGCTQDMLDNEVCDQECDTYLCNHDNERCGCALHCSDADLGTCDTACFTLGCELDKDCTDSQARFSAYIFHLLEGDIDSFDTADPLEPYDLIGKHESCSRCSQSDLDDCSNTLSEGCTQSVCLYELGGCEIHDACENDCKQCLVGDASFCIQCDDQKINKFGECLDRCEMTEKVIELCFESECATKYTVCYPDVDETSEEEPHLLVVTSRPTDDEHNAFNSIQEAYSYVWKKYTVIKLKDDTYEVDSLELPSISTTNKNLHLRIESDIKSTIKLKSTNIQFTSDLISQISLKNLVFDGSLSINNDCRTDSCRYCPYVTQVGESYVNDRGTKIDDENEYNFKSCIALSSKSLFEGNMDMEFENCEFIEMRYKFESIISIYNRDLSLKNVNFTNVAADDGIESAVIHATCDIESCKNRLDYLEGTIKQVNNGFEYRDDIIQYPFLKTDYIKRVSLNNLNVFGNVLLCDSECFDFITIQRSFKINIENCVFYKSLFLQKLINIDSRDFKLTYTFDLDSDGTCSECKETTIEIYNNHFYSIFSEESLISIEENEYVNSIDIANNTIKDYIGGSNLLRINNKENNEKQQNGVVCSLLRSLSCWLIRKVHVEDNEFIEVYVPSIVEISYKADVLLKNNTIDINNDSESPETIVSDYMKLDETYISIDTFLDSYTQSLLNMLNLKGIFNLELTTGNTSGLLRKSASDYLIWIEDTSGNIDVNSLEFSDLTVPLLYIDGNDDSILNIMTVSFQNFGKLVLPLIQISNVPNVQLFNLTLEDISNSNVKALHIDKAISVTILDSNFHRIRFEDTSGGAIHIAFDEKHDSSLAIIGSNFTQCDTVNEGGVLFLIKLSGEESTVKIQIDESTFQENTSLFSGAALYLSSLELHRDSLISSSSFINNTGTYRGTLIFQQVSGYLKIRDSYFYRNKATYESSSIYITSRDISTLELENTVLVENQGESTIYASGNSPDEQIITKNCLFANNTGISIRLQKKKLVDASSRFISNTNYQGGACFYLNKEAEAHTSNSVFQSNTAPKGAVFKLADKSFVWITGATLQSNTATQEGGVLFLEQDSYFYIENSEIFDNYATYSSVFSLYTSQTVQSIIETSRIYRNSAYNQSIFINLSSLTFENIEMFENSADFIPGVYIFSGTVSFRGCSFYNQASKSTNFIQSFNAFTTIENSTFRNTGTSSQVISFENSYAEITNSLFENLISENGGAIYSRDSSIALRNSTFLNTLAIGQGGAFFASGGSLILENCYIENVEPFAIEASYIDLILSNSHFKHSKGGISCQDCNSLEISDSLFQNLGGAITLESVEKNNTFNIRNSVFVDNYSTAGAAIQTDHTNIVVDSCQFESNAANTFNSATGDGGAIQLLSGSGDSNATIINSKFVNNRADAKGGAIHWTGFKPYLNNNHFANNTATYGEDIASFPTRLSLLNLSLRGRDLSDTEASLRSVAPGQIINPVFIALLDHYGQVVSSDNQNIITAIPGQSTLVTGIVETNFKAGIAHFDSLAILGEPGKNFTIGFRSDLEIEDLDVQVELRSCVSGEVNTGDKCLICIEGSYSLDPTDNECKACPSSCECYGENIIVPKKGYWRSSNVSEIFWECPVYEACIGGLKEGEDEFISLTGRCFEGHRGIMCQSCISDYTYDPHKHCQKCPDFGLNIFWICLYAIVFCVLIAITVRSSLISAQHEKELHSVYLKIFLNYFQLVSIVMSFDLKWPYAVSYFFSLFPKVENASDIILSLECLLGEDAYFQKLIITASVPVVLGLLASVFWLIVSCVKKKNFMKNELIASLVILLFVVNPSVTVDMFNSMSCTEFEGEDRLKDNMDIICWDQEHMCYLMLVVIPTILLWVVLLPSLCLLYLYKNYHRLHLLRYRKQLGFLYNGYNYSTFYWEFVIILRKFLIILCVVFIKETSRLLIGVSSLVIVLISVFIHLRFQPYKNEQLNTAEEWGILVSVVTIIAGLFYLTGEIGEYTKLALFFLIIGVNIWFIQYLTRNLAKAVIEYIVNKPWFKRIFRKKVYKIASCTDFQDIPNIFQERIISHKPTNMPDLFLEVVRDFNQRNS